MIGRVDNELNLAIHALKNSPDPQVRMDAVVRLGGSSYPPAVPALVRALRDKDEDVGIMAAEALGRFGDISAVPGLAKSMDNVFLRSRALDSLLKLLDRCRSSKQTAKFERLLNRSLPVGDNVSWELRMLSDMLNEKKSGNRSEPLEMRPKQPVEACRQKRQTLKSC